MSRTKRLHDGAPTSGPRAADFYATPVWATRLILPRVRQVEELREHDPLVVVDPGCGDGAILRVVHEDNVRRGAGRSAVELASMLRGMDVRAEAVEQCRAQGFKVAEGDYLTDGRVMAMHAHEAPILMNPPYGGRDNLAQRFVARALAAQPRCASVWALLRLMWINDGQSTHKRVTWLREDVGMPDVYALPRRPSFTGKGNDATTYAWFHWRARQKNYPGLFTVLGDEVHAEGAQA